MQKNTYQIEGLDCAEEVSLLRRALTSQKGIENLDFDLLNGKMTVSYDETLIDSQKVIALLKSTGMRVTLGEHKKEELQTFWQLHGRTIMAIISAFFLLSGSIFHYISHPNVLDILGGYGEQKTHTTPLISIFCYLVAIATGGWFVVPKAFYAVKKLQADMNLLMVIAVIGAIAIGEWFEAATVTFLFAVAVFLERWSVSRARRAISALLTLSPTIAREIDPQTQQITEKKVEEVSVGSVIVVRPGEKVPLDGVVVRGASFINQAPITGESVPISKEPGDEIFAGTINEEGALECKVSKEAENTTLAKIIHLVQEAQSKRAPSEQWVEKFARYYTPIMILFSFLTVLIPPLLFSGRWDTWIYRGLVILVIACPCALVISTPVSIVSALAASAKNGVLIKGGAYLEALGRLTILAVDKTGTLTYGHPEVQKIVPLETHTESEILERVASLEKQSEHPLARAILKKAEEFSILPSSVENFQIIKGKGAEGWINKRLFWVGSSRFMYEKKQRSKKVHDLAQELEDEGHSIIALGNEEHVCGLISIADTPRDNIRETIAAIKKAGIRKVIMLTGDNRSTARALAEFTKVDEYHAEFLPEDKVQIIEQLIQQQEIVGMIGDGVNDAPAMAGASLGIAMGAIGTDVAIETADIALMSDDLSKIPWLIKHSRKTLKIIKQNIIFSLTLKIAFLALALFGLASLWMAIAADAGASLLVVMNGLRLIKH